MAHRPRRSITRHDVAHVTVPLRPVVGSLRNGRAFRVVRRCIAAGRDRFGFRHSRVLKTPTEVRNVLAYVLCNSRKHAAERGVRLERGWIDPFSSGPHFAGWCELARPPATYARGPCSTAPPRSWLLRIGWKRRGLIAVDTVPVSG